MFSRLSIAIVVTMVVGIPVGCSSQNKPNNEPQTPAQEKSGVAPPATQVVPDTGAKEVIKEPKAEKTPAEPRVYIEPKHPLTFNNFSPLFKMGLRGRVDYEQGYQFYVTKTLTFNPTSTFLVIGGRDQTGSSAFQFRDIATGKMTACVLNAHPRGFHNNEIIGLTFSPDGKYLATGCRFGRVKVWNVEKLVEAAKPILKLGGFGDDASKNVPAGVLVLESQIAKYDSNTLYNDLHLAFSPDGKFLFAGAGQDSSPALFGFLKCWRVPSGEEVFSKQIEGNVTGLGLLPDNNLVGSSAKGLKYWNATTGNEVGKKSPFAGEIRLESQCSTRLAIRSFLKNNNGETTSTKVFLLKADGTTVSRAIESPECPSGLSSFALSHDGRFIVTLGGERTKTDYIQVRRADNGVKIAEATGDTIPGTMAISPNNKLLVVGGYSNWVILFDLAPSEWEPRESDPITITPKPEPDKPMAKSPDARKLSDRLKGTKWINTNNVTFEWDADGKFLHKGVRRAFEVVDESRVRIVFGEKHIDTLVFDKDLRRFEQFSTNEPNKKPLFTGKRTN